MNNQYFTHKELLSFLRLSGLWTHKKEGVKHHAIDAYCEKLAQWALKRLSAK